MIERGSFALQQIQIVLQFEVFNIFTIKAFDQQDLLQENPSVDIAGQNFLRFFRPCVSCRQGGLTSSQQGSPHPEGSVGHDRVIGITQQCKINS